MVITTARTDLFPSQLKQDIDFIISKYPVWNSLRGRSLFITGATGFFGKWLLYTLARANSELNLNLSVHVLSRDPKLFLEAHPLFSTLKNWVFFKGDIITFSLPSREGYDFCIHGAASASAKLNSESPIQMFNEILLGTQRCLEEAKKVNVKRFLFLSSGAVYGKQPESLTHVGENFLGGPNGLVHGSAYAEAKRAAEFLVNQIGRETGIETIIGRAFAFVGPFLPLDTHFAIGNFILSALKKEPIHISGDGTPVRSYLYTSDLVGWILTLLVSGRNQQAYNLGSEKEISIKELAFLVSQIAKDKFGDTIDITISGIAKPGAPKEIYCPSTQKIRTELGLKEEITLENAIQKTLEWHHQAIA